MQLGKTFPNSDHPDTEEAEEEDQTESEMESLMKQEEMLNGVGLFNIDRTVEA